LFREPTQTEPADRLGDFAVRATTAEACGSTIALGISNSVKKPCRRWLHAMDRMGSYHVGIGLAIFGKHDHELGELVAAHIIRVKSEFSAGLCESAVQGDQFFIVESFGEHRGGLLKVLLRPA
jgi:hypothetical protein